MAVWLEKPKNFTESPAAEQEITMRYLDRPGSNLQMIRGFVAAPSPKRSGTAITSCPCTNTSSITPSRDGPQQSTPPKCHTFSAICCRVASWEGHTSKQTTKFQITFRNTGLTSQKRAIP